MNDEERNMLLPGERVDDLQWKNLRIIQSPDAFRFGMDAVLLADFAKVQPGSRVCDLGTGTGILRQLIRQYLATVPNVAHYRDEHVQFGGAGITVVDLE